MSGVLRSFRVLTLIAVAAAADYLVTGNVRHFPARLRAGVTVVSPAEFLQALSGAV